MKPGALVRLRDSKIHARSPRSVLKAHHIASIRLSPPDSPVTHAAPAPPNGLEGKVIRFFSTRLCAPRLLKRKKLAAAKYVFFAPPSLDPSYSLLEVLGADLVTAH